MAQRLYQVEVVAKNRRRYYIYVGRDLALATEVYVLARGWLVRLWQDGVLREVKSTVTEAAIR